MLIGSLLLTVIAAKQGGTVPFTFTEPQIGYLQQFKWTGEVPLNGSSTIFNEITESVQATLAARGITGAAVLVLENDKVVYKKGFGYANLTTLQPFTSTTASRCGSISKTACALAILRLANQGKLNLNDTLFSILEPKIKPGNYLPGWDKIRVRDLMDHASGLANSSTYLTSHAMAAEMGKHMRLNLRDLFTYVRNHVKTDGVGTKYSYSNLNFELLSLIIEVKTGQPFAAALHDLVVKPLGIPADQMFLSPTTTVPAGTVGTAIPKGTPEARCYQKSAQKYESIFQSDQQVPEAYGGLDGDILSGAGHIAFSVEAIAKMIQTLRARPTTFLKKALWDDLLTPPDYVALPDNGGNTKDSFYGKGMTISKSATGPMFAHGAMLMHAGGSYQPYKDNYEFVVIANCNMRTRPFVDAHLTNAVKRGFFKAGK